MWEQLAVNWGMGATCGKEWGGEGRAGRQRRHDGNRGRGPGQIPSLEGESNPRGQRPGPGSPGPLTGWRGEPGQPANRVGRLLSQWAIQAGSWSPGMGRAMK